MSLVPSLNELYSDQTTSKVSLGDQSWLNDIVNHLIENHAVLLTKVDCGLMDRSALETEIVKLLDKVSVVQNRNERIKEVINHMFGYGILQKYLENPEITDLIGTRHDHIFIKKDGVSFQIPEVFKSQTEFESFIKLIIVRNGGMLNENDCHSRVADEQLQLRINGVIAPRSGTGPFLSIRKHRKNALNLESLSAKGLLDETAMAIVKQIAIGSDRILICGKGASGKTTLLRAMINEIGNNQRLMICESDLEIYPQSPMMISQRVVQRGEHGRSITLENLIQDGLTMSLDGYCIGEITGKEAWSFVKAGYTDHRVLATIHSKGAEDALYRLLILSEIAALGISEMMAMKMIASSVDYILHMSNFKLISIDYVDKDEAGHHLLKRIYKVHREGDERGRISGNHISG